ncbi:digalactosyldiacylglycerol synthase 2, chloroplastic-like [Phoenix dactylifera]|uniref:Digalactosyldiacylglycerol synthase 2, chloroplastic n=1 Tax=Phoenix dactylifera TaxID=42345 RepID=A0A8B9ABS8_PHODC|nr:digalactosyldiacylglycerol synthase 2, chloroplastic-like [Phoenix dactylifera]XP_038980667.1 digalactosyldiacylglycerol synthase 2, chloroplastic-like [Phoenix dactylifera]XP_038980668.1 digalactosyldiacylglycerol synthase 2, chloroplastic-like [Phoenix dactylifera]XP_038980669.1 digalactosyldiacylglycerol synthase 2, chloroplastic-like [Phoenix dactylifera]
MSRKQHIAIFTTASLPWMTGTAVNPLFRAAYLAKNGDREVTLVIPWLSLKDQELVYPNKITFDSPSEHEGYVRQWLEERTDFISSFRINFYPGKFSIEMRSILPVGDITESIPDEEADIAVLEEPEHLTWYHHGKKWKTKFWRVIGVVHTNYLEYVKRERNGLIAFFVKYASSWVTRIYCHKVIRLSGATQNFPRSIICNVHGVNPKFLDVGKVKLGQLQKGEQAFTKGAYYIGKMVWNKGYRELLQLLSKHQDKLSGLQVDLYGNGEDSEEVQQAANKLSLPVRVYPGRDHADPLFHDYKVFLNPSTTDVVCTTTAEALAMGKIVICANHPSNEFFKQFPNCHIYNSSDEFVKLTVKALAEDPAPLIDDLRHELSWEAATERFVAAAELNQVVSEEVPPSSSNPFASTSFKSRKLSVEEATASLHQTISGIESARRAFGAIPKSLQPDEQQCKELGLVIPERKGSSRR